ncbi:MAG: glycosyltransferase family 4 protein [Hyphomicrobium sp.]|uniref:glycosyltransferase family 4 protein n=1 Tax=Hyphomicrobium sp. TaxID=82 RepID=UPI003D0C176C
MMRTVWILNHYAQEPGGPGGTRHFSLAQRLPRHGWQAAIIAASVEHATGRDRLPAGVTSRLDVVAGVPFLWLKTSPYADNGLARIRNMLDYTRRALDRSVVSALPPPDAIIGSSVHPLAAWAGARLARRYRVPFLFEVRDLWPQTLVDMGRLKPDSWTTRALQSLETRLYRQASSIVVLLPRAGDYIESLGISRSKVVWIPNGADLDTYRSVEPSVPSETFTLMYFGAHGTANGLENVLRAMRSLRDQGDAGAILLRLIGNGPSKPALMAMARDWQLTNVRFEDPVAKAAIPALAAEADAFVFNLQDVAVFKYGISSNKLFDYMAAGRPIIMAADAPDNPVDGAGAGLTVAPEQPEQLAAAILAMMRLSHDERARMGAAARQHVSTDYNIDALAERLAATLDHAAEPPRS